MPFSQSTLIAVNPPQWERGQVYLSWTSTSPAGTWWQVYINGALAWAKQQQWCRVPVPSGPLRIAIGMVNPGEEHTAWTSLLPAAPQRRVTLAWQSGSFQAIDLAGFYVYSSSSAGGSINYTTPVATLAAYPGGFNTGSTGQYSWTSGALDAGTWQFAVVPFDTAGNAGSGSTTTALIVAPPRSPAAFAGTQQRLQYNYTPSSTTLTWQAPAV